MTTSYIARAWRLTRLALHLLLGIAEVALLLPLRGTDARRRTVTQWSRRMCAILKINIAAHGQVPTGTSEHVVLVANHVSWVDIFVLNAVAPSCFVAKAEVRGWPLIGWLSERTGTLFVTRERRQDTHRVNREIARALAAGDRVAVFPEGSTTDGFEVIPFNASLLQPAIDADAMLAPVALRYYGPTRVRTDAVSYAGEMNLMQSIFRILAQRNLYAQVDFLPLIPTGGRRRREIAREAQALIADVVLSDSPIAAHLLEPVSDHRNTA